MKVAVSCKFMQVSNRIKGTSDDGKDYDYYRASFWHDDGELSFTVRNVPENSGSITRMAAMKFGDAVQLVVDFRKSRQNSSWFCNFVEVK